MCSIIEPKFACCLVLSTVHMLISDGYSFYHKITSIPIRFQVSKIEREELKTKASIKANKAKMDVCRVLCKALIQSKRAKNRIMATKAQINSASMQMQVLVPRHVPQLWFLSFAFQTLNPQSELPTPAPTGDDEVRGGLSKEQRTDENYGQPREGCRHFGYHAGAWETLCGLCPGLLITVTHTAVTHC